jgi:hypothetical protein
MFEGRLAMQATLSKSVTVAENRQAVDFTHSLMKSLLDRDGATYTVDISSAVEVNHLATPIRTFLLLFGAGTGGVSATVSPTLLGHSYPAMLYMVQKLNESGAGDAWKPDGARTVRIGEALHVFVSADSPLKSRTEAPDTLLEVPGAHLIEPHWFESRVVPRSGAPGLVRVLYGLPGGGGIYDRFRRRNMIAGADGGPQRHFSLIDGRPDASSSGW